MRGQNVGFGYQELSAAQRFLPGNLEDEGLSTAFIGYASWSQTLPCSTPENSMKNRVFRRVSDLRQFDSFDKVWIRGGAT